MSVDHAALTPTALIVLVETLDGSDETGPPVLRREHGDLRIFARLPGGAFLQSRGEWEVEGPTDESGQSHGYSMHDYGITDGRTGGGVVVITPPPDPGEVVIGFSWGDRGVSWVEATFRL